MARKRQRKLKVKNSSGSDLPQFRLSPGVKRGIIIVAFLLLAFLSLLSFFDAAGVLGRVLAKVFGLLLGWGSITAPLMLFVVALALLLSGRKDKEDEIPSSNLRVYIGGVILVLAVSGMLHVIAMRERPGEAFELVKQGSGGGYLGVLGAYPLYSLVDFWMSLAIFLGLIIVAAVMLFNVNLATLFSRSKKTEDVSPLSSAKPQGVQINNKMAAGFSVAKVNKGRADLDGVDEDTALQRKVNTLPGVDKTVSSEALLAKYRKGNWQLPPITLLEDSKTTVDSGNIEANVAIIQKTLANFGIEVEMGEVNVGPTVTQYTLRPSQGIKLAQILALKNDLALALAAPSIRIEAPIPGKSLVGIEIPNKANAIVRIKDVVVSEQFLEHKSNLAFALGRDVAGHPVIADLARMPHLLIAGSTGSGKSVAINSVLISLLYRNSPEEMRLIVIDPKRVELNLYNGIPHLLTPVIIDHQKAVNSLKWAVGEMDRRYHLLSEARKRNIGEYNAKAESKLPYIVVVIDELADLMAVAQADVEAAIVRLAQMARAVGLHLVVATQRPSVDIITGLIKANITARMAFAVASQVDSRTILDMAGAEDLLGSGDMLYVTAELSRPKRIQGTYISEKEVKNVVEFVASGAGEVEYDNEIVEKPRSQSSGIFSSDPGDDDDMLPEAIEVVKRAGKASASLLQRRLRIGYARAARLLDLMEEQGVIGPADGAKPREVYAASADRGDGEYNEGEYEEERENY